MIIWYSRECSSCIGNQSLEKMKQFCKKQGVDFEERRTILWKAYEDEANSIMEVNEGLKLPFFFNDETQEVLRGNTFTPTEELEKLIEKEIE